MKKYNHKLNLNHQSTNTFSREPKTKTKSIPSLAASRNTRERFLLATELGTIAATALAEDNANEASLSWTSLAIVEKHEQANLLGQPSLSEIAKTVDEFENDETLGDEATTVENMESVTQGVGIGL